MNTLIGSIYKILYESQENDFKVFLLRRKDNSIIKITGDFPVLLKGAKIEVHGNYKSHPKYGMSFKSEAHTFDYDKSTHSICLYIQSIAKWIGPERSMALADHFGDKLQEVIETTPERLTEVEGIGKKVAASLVEAWEFNRNMKDIKIFLHSLGLTDFKIKRLIGQFGTQSEDILKNNPWILCQHGFGFTTCDHIASKLSKDMTDTNRYQQFIIYVLNESSNSGHLFLYPSQILDAFNKYNTKAITPFKDGVLTQEEIAPHIKKMVDGAYIVQDGNKLYSLDSYFYESESARLLYKISTTKSSPKLQGINIEDFIQRFEKQNQIILSDAQRDAVRSFIKEKILIITGYPGTGKTTLIKAFVQLMKELGLSFELLTPTGIASKKLGMTAGCDAYTIHRRLGYKGKSWDCNALNKYSTDVVIVDELSMVDQEVFYRLVSALYSTTHMIFVGDNDQLPSVGPGYVLKELIDSGSFKVIRLQTIFRQEHCSDIIKEAKKIRDGDIDLSLFKSDSKSDIWHIADRNPERIEKTIIKFATQLKDNEKVKKEKMYFQIITPRNDGPLSVNSLNTALQSSLNPPHPDKKEIKISGFTIRKGDRIIIKKNNYELGVFNGDIGKVSFITDEYIVVDLDDIYGEQRRVEIPMAVADEMIKLAYSISCHKCVPHDTMIFSKRGVVPISSITTDDYVLTRTGEYRKVTWSGPTEDQTKVRITTRTGSSIDIGPDHRMLIADDRGLCFRKASEIVPRAYLCYRRMEIEGTPQSTGFVGSSTLNLPKVLDADLAWLMGFMVSFVSVLDPENSSVELHKPQHPNILEELDRILRGYGISFGYHYEMGKKSSICFSSFELMAYMESMGLKYCSKVDRTIPDIIFRAEPAIRWQFISGFADASGHISSYIFILSSLSPKLIIQTQLLLKSLGVMSFQCFRNREYPRLRIYGIDIITLRDKIRLRSHKRLSVLYQKGASLLDRVSYKGIPFGRFLLRSFLTAYQSCVCPSDGRRGIGIVNKDRDLYLRICNVRRGREKFSHKLLKHLINFSEKEKIPLPTIFQETLKDNLSFEEIVSITPIDEKVPMWDIEVEKDHSYIINGYIGHNSQGSEYAIVILPLIKAHGSFLLQRNLLYTAITRAKKKVVILGQSSAIESAIQNDKIQKRNTIFSERIRLWMQGKGTSLRDIFSAYATSPNAAVLERLLSLEEREL